MSNHHDRKRPAREDSHLEKSGITTIVFVTVCTRKRHPILANDISHQLLVSAWKQAKGWNVGKYMILPDHLHLFCHPIDPEFTPLKQWVQFWKSRVSARWPKEDQKPVWQASFWDRDIRSDSSYSAKWNYVEQNPVRHGLVTSPDAWPFQGELAVL